MEQVLWSVSHEPLHTEDPHLNFHGPRDNLETAVFVSQYSERSSSTSSFVGDCLGSLPYVHCANPGCTSMNAARPAGESVMP